MLLACSSNDYSVYIEGEKKNLPMEVFLDFQLCCSSHSFVGLFL